MKKDAIKSNSRLVSLHDDNLPNTLCDMDFNHGVKKFSTRKFKPPYNRKAFREGFVLPEDACLPIKEHNFSFFDKQSGSMKPDDNPVVRLTTPQEKERLLSEADSLDDKFVKTSVDVANLPFLFQFLDLYGRGVTKSTFWPAMLVLSDRHFDHLPDAQATFEKIVIMINVEFLCHRVRALQQATDVMECARELNFHNSFFEGIDLLCRISDMSAASEFDNFNPRGVSMFPGRSLSYVRTVRDEDNVVFKCVCVNDGKRHSLSDERECQENGEGSVLADLYSCHNEIYRTLEAVKRSGGNDFQPTFQSFQAIWVNPEVLADEWFVRNKKARWMSEVIGKKNLSRQLLMLTNFFEVKSQARTGKDTV